MTTSRFQRMDLSAAHTELNAGTDRFLIALIEGGDHYDIPQLQKLLLDELGTEEVDSEEILRHAVEGKTPWGTDDETQYRVHIIKNIRGEVVSMLAGGLLDLLNGNDQPTGKMVFMVGYAVTLPNARQAGLAREAYISAILDAYRAAKAQGKALAFAAGECTYTSERFWNAMGWRRVYVTDRPAGTHSYTELKYVQPPLDYDGKTGEVAKTSGYTPEHFMIDAFDPAPPSKKEIMQIVKAFYRWCNKWPRDAFVSDEACQRHLAHVQNLEHTLWHQIARGGQLVYLDEKSREDAKKAGATIKGYPDSRYSETCLENTGVILPSDPVKVSNDEKSRAGFSKNASASIIASLYKSNMSDA